MLHKHEENISLGFFFRSFSDHHFYYLHISDPITTGLKMSSPPPKPMKATSNGSFQGENPLDYALPLLILQMILVVVFTRCLAYALKPLRQPRVIAEIIGGILLGPSALGRNQAFLHRIFPVESMTVLETVANIGLCFFLFLVGLELDFNSIRRTGKKALAIAVCGITLPFILGIASSTVLRATVSKGVQQAPFLVFNGVALSITAFPVLARILAELKLLTTDVGRIAMSAAAVNDVAAWILLALAIALSGTDTSPLVSVWVLLSGAGFVGFALVAVRPLLAMLARRSIDGEPVRELYICITLSIVLAAAFVTDTIGIHALFGAFVIGIIMPKEGPFAGVLIEKIEDLVSVLFLPLYFVSSGLKTDVTTIRGAQSWGLLVLVIFTASFGKIVGTVVVSLLFKVPLREAIALGVLMNTKGLVELIVLNIGKDRKVLNDQTFAIFVTMALVTTFITTPLVIAVYRPARTGAPYKLRSVSRKNPYTELRILACFHSTRSIPTMINVFESSRGTRKRAHLTVYAMHLMELSERSSAISMVHKARYNGLPFWNKKGTENADQMVIAFEAYEQLSTVRIRPATAISSMNRMHEVICACAHQKTAAMILLPFHKHQKLDGSMESFGHSFQLVNEHVLRHAPCSVGILVDRGLGGTTQVSSSDMSYSTVVAFFGGSDDREALAYGMRVAEHPGISMTVVRFMARKGKTLRFGAQLVEVTADNKKIPKFEQDNSDENEEDENVLEVYKKLMASCNKESDASDPSMTFEEKVVDSKGEIALALKGLSKHSLFIVGRMPPTLPLVESSDCPELGPIGSFLASTEFSSTASALVIQQYDATATQPLVVEEADYELKRTASVGSMV